MKSTKQKIFLWDEPMPVEHRPTDRQRFAIRKNKKRENRRFKGQRHGYWDQL